MIIFEVKAIYFIHLAQLLLAISLSNHKPHDCFDPHRPRSSISTNSASTSSCVVTDSSASNVRISLLLDVCAL